MKNEIDPTTRLDTKRGRKLSHLFLTHLLVVHIYLSIPLDKKKMLQKSPCWLTKLRSSAVGRQSSLPLNWFSYYATDCDLSDSIPLPTPSYSTSTMENTKQRTLLIKKCNWTKESKERMMNQQKTMAPNKKRLPFLAVALTACAVVSATFMLLCCSVLESFSLQEARALWESDLVSMVSSSSSTTTLDLPLPVPTPEDLALPLVAFYHIYVPPFTGNNMENITLAMNIVAEQIGQVRESYAAHSAPVNKPLKVYYITIGNRQALNETHMQHLCTGNNTKNATDTYDWSRTKGEEWRPLDCQHVQHYEAGHEERTLRHLHSFCSSSTFNYSTANNDDNDEQQQPTVTRPAVIYFHNKGAFGQRVGNTAWRRHLTAAAMSEMCVRNVVDDDHQPTDNNSQLSSTSKSTCNLCGLNFYPLWTFFVPGNIWIASCSYIAQLHPIESYAMRTQNLYEEILKPAMLAQQQNDSTEQSSESSDSNQFFLHRGNSTTTGTATSTLIQLKLYNGSEADNVGLERFSNEHWIGSHPDCRPCDVSPTQSLGFWNRDNKKKSVKPFVWAMAPRHDIMQDVKERYRFNATIMETMLQEDSLSLTTQQVITTTDNVVGSSSSSSSDRSREYFLLPGLLLKWDYLYGRNEVLPALDSWIWTYFPDGLYWREAFQRHGLSQLVQPLWPRSSTDETY